MINILASTHFGFFQTALFGKADILDIAQFGHIQVLFRGKSAVKADFERIAPVYLILTVQHRDGQIGVRRITAFNHTIEDQVGNPACQTNFVAEERFTPVFYKDVGVRLENRNDFFPGRNLLIANDTAPGLSDHLPGKLCIMFDLIKMRHGDRIGAALCCKDDLSRAGVIEHLPGYLEQIDISGLALAFAPGVHHGQHAAFGPAAVVAKAGHLAVIVLYANDQPGQNTHGIPQQGRVGGRMDIAFHTSAIGADLAPLFNILILGIAQQIAVDHLPCRIADSLDVAVEGGFLKTLLRDTNPAKPPQSLRIDDMKGQL